MGREIRRVPPNWVHPKKKAFNAFKSTYEEILQPMYDSNFEERAARWKLDLMDWEETRKSDPDYGNLEYWEYAGSPPDREYFRPWKDEEATWFQVWETVSEGTPVTPPFETKKELVDYLVTHGDFWDQKRNNGPWNLKNAIRFAEIGFAMSMTIENGQVKQARDH